MGLKDNILLEQVSHLALRKLIVVDRGATVRAACDAMKQDHLGCAMVLDEAGKPIGMFNEKLLINLVARRPEAMDDPIELHMTRNVICVCETDTIAKLIATMQQRKLRWVCVVNEEGVATALTGLRGVTGYVVDHFPRRVKVTSLDSKLAIDEREGA